MGGERDLWTRQGARIIGATAETSRRVLETEQNRSSFTAGIEPRLVALSPNSSAVVPLLKYSVKVQLYLSVAFIRIEGEWALEDPNWCKDKIGYVFELPKKHTTTVTYANAIMESGVVFEAHVVEDTAALAGYKDNEGKGMARAIQLYKERSGYDPSSFNPELFSFPFHGNRAGEKIRISVDILETLDFHSGKYILTLPFGFSSSSLTNGRTLNQVLKLDVDLYIPMFLANAAMGMETFWDSLGLHLIPTTDTRPLSLEERENGLDKIALTLDTSIGNSPCDFQLRFIGWTNEIYCQSLRDTSPMKRLDGEKIETYAGGVVSTFISPPRPEVLEESYPRDVVFILDRSGSMGFSNAFPYAQRALVTALKELRQEDRFAICCFDDRQIWFGGCCPEPSDADVASVMRRLQIEIPNDFSSFSAQVERPSVKAFDATSSKPKTGLESPEVQESPSRYKPLCIQAKPEYIEKAIAWVNGITPAGTTDILTPMKQGFWGLFNNDDPGMAASEKRLKTMFLLTDGAVENEREICKFAGLVSKHVRVFSFGIGIDCNAYFLRKLASIGRGHADVCMLEDTLEEQMSTLFEHAQIPVLKDIKVQLLLDDDAEDSKGGVSQGLSLYWSPAAVPDLYCHAPVLVSCSYTGILPETAHVQVSGVLPGGQLWASSSPILQTKSVPLRKVFAKQVVEMLVADAWLADVNSAEGEALKKQCIQMAVSESIPCPHTQMVAVEKTLAQFEEERKALDERERRLRFRLTKSDKFVLIGASLVGAVAFGSIAASLAGGLATSAGADAAAAAADVSGGGEDCCGECCDDGCDCDGDCCVECLGAC